MGGIKKKGLIHVFTTHLQADMVPLGVVHIAMHCGVAILTLPVHLFHASG